MNAFLRNVETARLREHEAQLVATPLDALPGAEVGRASKRTELLLSQAERRERRESLRTRAKQLRAADWTWAEVADELGLTPTQLGTVQHALLRERARNND